MKNRVCFSHSTNPFWNLAAEEALFFSQEEGITLYLWQNENTVVIGKNQNAWKECRMELLESEGGRLARRSSGGGAVFHDLGNLNFTFLVREPGYDLPRQLSVIRKACASFGVDVLLSGRNDLVVTQTGAKFSGNAFRFARGFALHHGTILIGVDMEKLSRYLAPPEQKYRSKGIESVRARVVNLSSLNPAITVPAMRSALVDAFCFLYGATEELPLVSLGADRLAELTEKYASDAWRLGRSPDFDVSLERRFSFGQVELLLSLRGACIQRLEVYSDAMNADLADALRGALLGSPYDAEAMASRVLSQPFPESAEIAAYLSDLRL